MLYPCSPAWVTHPATTSSIVAGSTPARATAAFSACARRSSARILASAPFFLPMAVRTAETMTASAIPRGYQSSSGSAPDQRVAPGEQLGEGQPRIDALGAEGRRLQRALNDRRVERLDDLHLIRGARTGRLGAAEDADLERRRHRAVDAVRREHLARQGER